MSPLFIRRLVFPLVISFCLVPLLVSAEDSSAQKPPFIGLVTADRVNLRAGPGLSYETLLQLSKGSKVRVAVRQGSWYGIILPADAPAYIEKSFLVLEQGKGKVRGRRVHVRAGPGQAYTSMGFLADQETVSVRRVAGQWVEIDPPAVCRGWVNESYVTFLERDQKESSNGNDRGVSTAAIEGGPDSGGQNAPQR